MVLEFKVKKHFGRVDFYPMNEAARLLIDLKRLHIGAFRKVDTMQLAEVEILKKLGFEIKIIQELNEVI